MKIKLRLFAFIFALLLLPISASAITFQSRNVGIQVGDGSATTSIEEENLIYGVLGPSSTGSLLLLQNGFGNDRLRVDYAGNVTIAGTLSVSGQSVCLADGTNCPAVTAQTLQAVTNAGSITTLGITVATINTGLGANELYAMNQNVRTTDSPTFAALTLGTSIASTQTANAHFYFNSRRGVQIRLDSDNNTTDTFKINNGANATVFSVDELGNATFAGVGLFGGQLGVSGRITGVVTPSAGTDAANKDYVDTAVAAASGGLDIQEASCNTTIGGTDETRNCSAVCPAGYGLIDHAVNCTFNSGAWFVAEGSELFPTGWVCTTLSIGAGGATFYTKPPAGHNAAIYGGYITCAKN